MRTMPLASCSKSEIRKVREILTAIYLFSTEATINRWTTPPISTKDGTGKLNVSESQATSETIITFIATSDSQTITYSLVTPVPPFELSNNGALTITGSLDAKTAPTYTLEVQ